MDNKRSIWFLLAYLDLNSSTFPKIKSGNHYGSRLEISFDRFAYPEIYENACEN